MFLPQLQAAIRHVKPPVLLVLGSPRAAAEVAAELPEGDNAAFQFDLYQTERLAEELAITGSGDWEVESRPDLWDLPRRFQTVVYLAPERGDRELKLDVVEQAFHVLVEGGVMVTLSGYENDSLFGPLHKKIYGRTSSVFVRGGSAFWSTREGDRPRRRHEVTYHAKSGADGESCEFLSRPGVFTYGRLDDGARALMEDADIFPGAKVLDLGCGAGTNGVFAAKRAGDKGHVTFVDSNVRAVALAEINAKANALPDYKCQAARQLEGLPPGFFDIVLANPPYFAQAAIARMFIERGRAVMSPRGQFYLVTKQPNTIVPMFHEGFAQVTMGERRGYHVLAGRKPTPNRLSPPPRGKSRGRDEEE